METDNKKSATDILLDIEARLGILEKKIQNEEYLLKILLSRFNVFLDSSPQITEIVSNISPQVNHEVHQISTPGVVNKDNFETRPKTTKFAEAAASHGIEMGDDSDSVISSETDNDGFVAYPMGQVLSKEDHDDMIESPSRGNSRGQRGPKTKGVKCSVSQNLTRDDSPLFLANVELLDENGSLVSQTRTNTKGRWMLALAPGSYQVHVTKRFPPDSGKGSIDVTYPVMIPPSDKPMELNPLSLSGDG